LVGVEEEEKEVKEEVEVTAKFFGFCERKTMKGKRADAEGRKRGKEGQGESEKEITARKRGAGGTYGANEMEGEDDEEVLEDLELEDLDPAVVAEDPLVRVEGRQHRAAEGRGRRRAVVVVAVDNRRGGRRGMRRERRRGRGRRGFMAFQNALSWNLLRAERRGKKGKGESRRRRQTKGGRVHAYGQQREREFVFWWARSMKE
jgi:hypothetical protein